jgi:hypothetical protein
MKTERGLIASAIFILTAFVIVGCATTAKYEKVLNSWTGADINQLVSKWGYPDNSFQAPNGNRVYVYSRSGSYTMPTNTNINYYGNYAYATTTGGQTINLRCTTYFEVDGTGKIIKWSYKGNNCKSK